MPANARPSERYRQRFNDVAKELKIDAQWVKDEKNPLAVDAEEIQSASSYTEEDIRKVLAEVEKRRLASVEASALYHTRIPFRAPLELLNPVERRAVELFAAKVKPALDRIEAKTHDPRAGELAEWMKLNGDHYSKRMFDRFHRDACAGIQFARDPACSLFPYYPDQPSINGMIDASVAKDLKEFQEVSKGWDKKDERSRPTTLLSRNGKGDVAATPAPLHPALRADHLEMAKALEEIANLNVQGEKISLKLKNQLLAWAKFFKTGKAADEARAVQATIDAGDNGGRLRVHFGPSESYWDDNTKFPYLLQIGIKDPQISEFLAKSAALYAELEKGLTDIPHYTPRTLSVRGGFADPMYQAMTGGFFQTFPFREPAANNFPNYDGYEVEGSNRFIALEAVAIAGEQVKTAMSQVLDEDISTWDSRAHFLPMVAGHESGHLIGPLRGHITPSGKKMGTVFGAHWADAEEPKADLTAAAAIRYQYLKGDLSPKELHDKILAVFGLSCGNRYKGKAAFTAGIPAHYYGYVMEMGYYFKTGALTLANHKIHIDDQKFLEASYDLWKKVMTFQAAGDLKGYQALSNEAVTHIPDEADQLILNSGKNLPTVFIERHL